MTPSEYREIQDIVAKSKAFTNELLAGKVDLDAFCSDAASVVEAYGIPIAALNRVAFNEAMPKVLAKHGIRDAPSLPTVGDVITCAACDVGLGIALAALAILTVAAVVATTVLFAPEVAGPAVLAFLSSSAAVSIVLGVIITSCGVVATLLCTYVIKCA